MNPPFPTFSIVLVRPNFPENVGFVARSMKAMGFESLILVDPGFRFCEESPAYKTACGAHEILHQAQVFRHFEDAIAPFHHVIGFSRRMPSFERSQEGLVPFVEANFSYLIEHKTALVFGTEDYGLSNAEKGLCKKIVTIPLQAETMSLNLSHAVTVVLYELDRARANSRNPENKSRPKPVTHEAQQRILHRLIGMLEPTPFFKEGRKQRQIEDMRNLILKMDLDENQYNAVMGMLAAMEDRSRK